jgi:O-methyltransferase
MTVADVKTKVLEEVNRAFARVSGYRLEPVRPAPSDATTDALIAQVRPYTMSSNEKIKALAAAVRYLDSAGIAGDIVECGVWRGGSMHVAARVLDSLGDHGRDLYLFDTYEGMSVPTVHDVRFDGTLAADRLAAFKKHRSSIWAYASLEDVTEGFRQVPYPAEKVHFVKGRVEDTVPGAGPDQIALLRLDTDWYESTAHELTHLYHRLVPGGVLVLDDYEWWQGARRAVDEFLVKADKRLFLVPMGDGRIAVKI